MYESVCVKCNGPEKEKTSSSLADSRTEPSIYVGETGRSLMERSKEHHRDLRKHHEDSHMLKHWATSHPEEEKPRFHQYVVGKYSSCLDRQIGEAVRIQLRANTLNSMGVYNRCKLTRLVVDTQWDQKTFKANWEKGSKAEKAEGLQEEGEEVLEKECETQKRSEKRHLEKENTRKNKRRKVGGDAIEWGKEVRTEDRAKVEFLMGENNNIVSKTLIQKKLAPVNESSLVSHAIIREIIKSALTQSAIGKEKAALDLYNVAIENDEDWVEVNEKQQESTPRGLTSAEARTAKRAAREEEAKDRVLRDVDVQSRRKEVKLEKEKAARIAKANVLKDKARNLRKITEFFRTSKPEPMEVDNFEPEDMDMEVDLLDWKQQEELIAKLEKMSRLKRAERQRKALIQALRKKEQEKQQLVEHLKTMILEEWLEEQGKPSKWMEEGPPGLQLQWSLEEDSGLGRLERSGSLVRKGKLISWTTEVEISSLVEVRERMKTEMKQWLLELTMVALEGKNEIAEATLELSQMRIGKEDNVVAKGAPDQTVPDQQLGEDHGLPAPQVPPGSEQHEVAGRALGKKRKRKARTDLESSRSVLETDICQFYDTSGQYKSMPMLPLPKGYHHVGDGQQADNIQVLKTNKRKNKNICW